MGFKHKSITQYEAAVVFSMYNREKRNKINSFKSLDDSSRKISLWVVAELMWWQSKFNVS